MMKPGVKGDAGFSDDRSCRWWLKRWWDEPRGLVLYVGLNPSKAGKDNDDMTVAKGIGFARLWGLGGTFHGNAFPFIATDPADLVLSTKEDIRRNDESLVMMARQATRVVVAWGSYPQYAARFRAVTELLAPYRPICLGRTKDGYPKHISRLAYWAPVMEFA
jgi:hypothetical protein